MNTINYKRDIANNLSKFNLTISSEKKEEIVSTTSWGEFLNTPGFFHQKLDNFVKANYSLLQLHCTKNSSISDTVLPYHLTIFVVSGVVKFEDNIFSENSIINIKADESISFTAIEDSNLILKLVPELELHYN